MIDAGKHHGRAISADVGRSKNKGTPFVRVQFAIVNHDDVETGEQISWDGWLTDAAAERTLESLMACGWNGEDWTGFAGITDKTVQLNVVHETYDDLETGQTKQIAKVAWVNKLGGGRAISEELRITGSERDALARSMRARVVAARNNQRTQKSNGGDDFDFPAR